MIIQQRIRTKKMNQEKRAEQGYALLLVIFLATVLLIVATMVAPNIQTQGQREKEKEMIWRGKQYARGVKLYYRKLGRFPTSIDDLTKPKLGSLRFMRQAYKDPMNTQDGSWRFIYVGPAGQLIGSLKPGQQNLMFGQAGVAGAGAPGIGTPAGSVNGPGQPGAFGQIGSFSQSGTLGQLGQSSPFAGGSTNSGMAPGTNPTNPAGATGGATVSTGQGTDSNAPIATGDTPSIIGGNIIGVGSKINKQSVIVYDKAKNYRQFEFIWDPSKDTFGMGQPGLQTGTGFGQPIGQPIGQPAGQNPFGQQPGQNPQPNPPQPPQNPQQQQ